MAQFRTRQQFSILGGWNGRRRYNIDMTCGFESEIDWYIHDIAITIVSFITILQNNQKVSCFVTID